MTPRIIAIDWSGAASAAARRKIWLAEARDGVLLRLESGRDRREVVEHLIDERRRTPHMVVGLDFGFAFPAWYMRELGCATAPELWRRMAEGEAERWLAACAPPFWGRPTKRLPVRDGATQPHLRRTELETATSAPNDPGAASSAPTRGGEPRPKSVFQIGGAGAVGTGSLRGMAALHELREAGFAIWPFDPPSAATAIEIYPRLFTGPVVKSREDARRAFVEERYPRLRGMMREAAIASEDAFDAAVSAIEMSRHTAALGELPEVDDPVLRMEGLIWRPRSQFS